MKSKLLFDGAEKTHAIIMDSGDEAFRNLTEFARRNRLRAAHLTGIGAVSSVVLGYFDWERKVYRRIPVEQQLEVISLVGDFALDGNEPKLHAHIVVAKADGTAMGGHLIEAHVRPTLEVIVTESPAHLCRYSDAETGLALIRL